VSEPDLFVICKNCSAEVSPYVTECPYCGERVRKRAPRLERLSLLEEEAPPKRRRTPSLGRLKRGEIPGIAPETRPWATVTVIAVSLLLTIVLATAVVGPIELGAAYADFGNEWWRVLTSWLVHDNRGYQFIALLVIGIFGMHLERRFGALALLALVFACGAAGTALAAFAGDLPAVGANGVALGLLCAWLVDDRRALRRGDDRETDLIGVYVIAAVLVALPLAAEEASMAAAAGGAVTGVLCGLIFSALRR